MSRVGPLAVLVTLLCIASTAAALPTAIQDGRLVLLQDPLHPSGEPPASEPQPAESRGPEPQPSEPQPSSSGPQGRGGTVAVIVHPVVQAAEEVPVPPTPVGLPPLAGLLRQVRSQADELPVEETLADLLGEEPAPETPAAWTTIAAAPTHSVPAAILVASAATAATFAVFFFSGSTSAAGASGLGGSSAARKLPVFSPLFTRFEGKRVLEHPNREQLYTLVATRPGIRLQDLCEETLLSRTAVTHHMRLLEQQHLIVSKKVGRSRHFYENGGRFERQQKDAYAVLQNDRSRDIARFIQTHPGSIQKDLCDALDLRASIAHWHVKRLAEAQLVEPIRSGRTVSYFPAEAMAQVAI